MSATPAGLTRPVTAETLNVFPSVSLTAVFSVLPRHVGAVSRNYGFLCLCPISPSRWNVKDYGSPTGQKSLSVLVLRGEHCAQTLGMNQLVHGPASPAAAEDGAPFLGFRGTTGSDRWSLCRTCCLI